MTQAPRLSVAIEISGYALVVVGAVLLELSHLYVRVGPYTIGREFGPPPGLYPAADFSPAAALLVIAFATLSLTFALVERSWLAPSIFSCVVALFVYHEITWNQLATGVQRSSEGTLWVLDGVVLAGCVMQVCGAILGRRQHRNVASAGDGAQGRSPESPVRSGSG